MNLNLNKWESRLSTLFVSGESRLYLALKAPSIAFVVVHIVVVFCSFFQTLSYSKVENVAPKCFVCDDEDMRVIIYDKIAELHGYWKIRNIIS